MGYENLYLNTLADFSVLHYVEIYSASCARKA